MYKGDSSSRSLAKHLEVGTLSGPACARTVGPALKEAVSSVPDAQSTRERVQVISGSAESCPENVFKEQAKRPEPAEAEGKGTHGEEGRTSCRMERGLDTLGDLWRALI